LKQNILDYTVTNLLDLFTFHVRVTDGTKVIQTCAVLWLCVGYLWRC